MLHQPYHPEHPTLMKGKHIIIGITGSIAAYKACTLVRLCVKAGAEVIVVMTPAAKEFVTPLTLATLSRHAVVSEFFDRRDGSWHSHVDLGLWADAMVIAPATAATIGKMAHGIADNMLVTTYLSMKAPVFVAPAMDLDMFAHPTTQENLLTLQHHGVRVIAPAEGELASALVGKGRMDEPEHIFDCLKKFFGDTAGTATADCPAPQRGKLLLTAGPTHEYIDPVRFIGNCSTGKMGYALAEAAAEAGFEVELVSGPTDLTVHHPLIHRTDVTSAAEMHEAAARIFGDCRAAILCAAVADFTPANRATEKIKREATGEWNIPLKPTADIAKALGQCKTEGQVLAGFALETHNERSNAVEKMKRKQFDFIVLNSLRDEGAGFGHDTNKVDIIDCDGTTTPLPLKPKTEVARDIVRHLCALIGKKH